MAGTHDVSVDGSTLRLAVDPDHLDALVAALAPRGVTG